MNELSPDTVSHRIGGYLFAEQRHNSSYSECDYQYCPASRIDLDKSDKKANRSNDKDDKENPRVKPHYRINYFNNKEKQNLK